MQPADGAADGAAYATASYSTAYSTADGAADGAADHHQHGAWMKRVLVGFKLCGQYGSVRFLWQVGVL